MKKQMLVILSLLASQNLLAQVSTTPTDPCERPYTNMYNSVLDQRLEQYVCTDPNATADANSKDKVELCVIHAISKDPRSMNLDYYAVGGLPGPMKNEFKSGDQEVTFGGYLVSASKNTTIVNDSSKLAIDFVMPANYFSINNGTDYSTENTLTLNKVDGSAQFQFSAKRILGSAVTVYEASLSCQRVR